MKMQIGEFKCLRCEGSITGGNAYCMNCRDIVKEEEREERRLENLKPPPRAWLRDAGTEKKA